jgi:glycosyltransferase involved in cell wall biosynthesis
MVSAHANVLLACSGPALARAPRLKNALLTRVLHYGIDLAAFNKEPDMDLRSVLGLDPGTPLIGHVGRFYEQKNHKGLVDIFALVLKEMPETRLVLIGEGPLKPQIQDYVRSLGIADHVWFLGARLDVPELLSQIDVFAFPSKWEGLGIAIIEARLTGLPVVASDLPAIAELLESCNGYTLVDYRDHQAFANAIISYLRHKQRIPPPEIWKQAFSRERSVNELLNIYRQCLAR